MARFQRKKRQRVSKRMAISAIIFILILVIFYQGLSSLSSTARARQRESLENALTRGITYCYAVEGNYPESLDYLKEHYGLTYDEDHFYVDYQVTASNILPDVTIIEKGE